MKACKMYFFVCLTSLTKHNVFEIHLCWWVYLSVVASFFIAEYDFIVWIEYNVFINSPANCIGLFPIFASDFFFFREETWLDHKLGIYLTLWEIVRHFSEVVVPVYTSPAIYESSSCSASLQRFGVVRFQKFSHSSRCILLCFLLGAL